MAGPWPGGRGRMAVAGGRVICMWSGWPAGRMAVAVAGRPACGRVAGWAGVVGWPARWLFAWPDGRAMPKLCRARVEPRLASALEKATGAYSAENQIRRTCLRLRESCARFCPWSDQIICSPLTRTCLAELPKPCANLVFI